MPRVPPRTGSIKPGEARNPKGSSARARTLKTVSKLTAEQVASVGALILTNDRAQLQEIATDKEASVLQVWTAGLIVKSMQKGDPAVYKAILERIVGKPKETHFLLGEGGGPIVTRVESDEEKIDRINALRKAREELGE